MLAGAWGTQAGELLARTAEARGARVHRCGELTMLAAPDLLDGSWRCWLFGEPEDRGTLATRFGLQAGGDLRAAFGHALATLGEQAHELLCGRFVLVTCDRARDRCLLTRDQLGAQPLVYVHVRDGVLFAEHERDLLELLPRTPAPDRLALLQWIDAGHTPKSRTFFQDVQRLPAAHQLVFGGGEVRVERWWTPRYREPETASAAILAEHVRVQAFAAVRRAAAGSERPALKLSGGLDSACVAAGLAASGLAGGRAVAIAGTFSAHPETDESHLIEATARHTHLRLEQIAFSSERSILAPALEHISRWRLPPATPNLFLWQPVMARARELGIDRMLDGEGGDELFGVAPYLIADMLRTGRLGSAWSLTSAIPGVGESPDWRLRLRLLRRYGLAPLQPNAIRRRREAARPSPGSIVPQADAVAIAQLDTSSQADRYEGPLWWRHFAESLIDERDLLDVGAHFRREAADEELQRRHPFLYDLQLTEAMLRVPPRTQFDADRDRPLLRDALAGLIPEAVRTRYAKSQFSAVVLAAIRAEESELIEPMRAADAPIRAYVAREALERRISVPPDERSMLSITSLWRLAIADRWLLSQQGQGS